MPLPRRNPPRNRSAPRNPDSPVSYAVNHLATPIESDSDSDNSSDHPFSQPFIVLERPSRNRSVEIIEDEEINTLSGRLVLPRSKTASMVSVKQVLTWLCVLVTNAEAQENGGNVPSKKDCSHRLTNHLHPRGV
jgi:hypothetical protein